MKIVLLRGNFELMVNVQFDLLLSYVVDVVNVDHYEQNEFLQYRFVNDTLVSSERSICVVLNVAFMKSAFILLSTLFEVSEIPSADAVESWCL